MRIRLFFWGLCLGFICLAISLFHIQIIRGEGYYRLSRKNHIRLIPRPARRGNILDRKGRLLADSRLSFAVRIIPQELRDKKATFGALARILNTSEHSLERAYRRGYTAPFAWVMVRDNITKKEALSLRESEDVLPGVFVQARPRRRYLYKDMFAHIIGYLGEVDEARMSRLKSYGYKIKDLVGYTGIEQAQDNYLHAKEGGMQIEVDSRGRMVGLLGLRPSEHGRDVRLTVDLDIQRIAYNALGHRKGCIIVINPYSGAILAMVSKPAYDPNVFMAGRRREIMRLLNARSAPLFNRAIRGRYPPASLFKLVTAAAALGTKRDIAQMTVFCSGGLKIGNRKFGCWSEHKKVDFIQAIAQSCDVFFYRAGIKAGVSYIADYAFKFGLGRKTGLDIPGEVEGVVPTPGWKRWRRGEAWFSGDTANMSIGQGALLVTPIQIARLISVFANGGFLVRPYLTEGSSIADAPQRPRGKKRVSLRRGSFDILRKALISVVKSEQGTAHILDAPGLSVAGKTGTAQVRGRPSHAWFAGFSPVKTPKIAFVVFLEHGGSSHLACVVAREMLEGLIREKIDY
ncbi:MAG: penicillin-binding protein 2 [Candidatus Omnitrophota bacterium]